jgi:ABC-2 type transport system ATP-binding protein
MIEVRKLSYWYGRVLALNDVSVQIPPGIIGLVGPNGSGKTTLMRLIVGLQQPETGAIRIDGESPWANTELSRWIGYAPESEIGFQRIHGRELVEFILRMKGFSPADARRRSADIIERTHAAPFAEKPISIMSRGMRQRIKLAAALASDPRVLVLDEPLMGADPIARAEILRLIRAFATGEKTVLMSTHVLQEIEELTDQIVLLHRGHLLAQGRIHEIRALIDRHPHEVRIVTRNVRELAKRLAAEPDIKSMQLEESVLLVRTSAPVAFYPKFTRIVAESGLTVDEMSSPDDNLEAVFKYLTEK